MTVYAVAIAPCPAPADGRACGRPATHEVVDYCGGRFGAYCREHAEERARWMNADERRTA